MFRTVRLVGVLAIAFSATSAGAVTFAYTGGLQTYQIANAGIYNVQAFSAQGGGANNHTGGYGAGVGGDVTFALNTNLDIYVGGHGGNGLPPSPNNVAARGGGGGGGGTFVFIGNAPVIMAGGGGGAGLRGSGTDASFTQAGNTGGNGGAGNNGSGGYPGFGYDNQSGGGAGLFYTGQNGNGGGGGGTLPLYGGYTGFAGGSGSEGFNAGGFGGGGGGSGGSGGGGGGGYSGGSGASFDFPGGGGGLFNAGVNQTTTKASGSDGLVTIDAVRLFAVPLAYGSDFFTGGTIDFGTVRPGITVQKTIIIRNLVDTGPVSDTLVTTSSLFSFTPQITSVGAPGPLAPGESGSVIYTLAASTPGYLGGFGFDSYISTSASGSDVYAGSDSFRVNGKVTDPAHASITNIGSGQLSVVNGKYILNFGDVAAGSSALSTRFIVGNGASATPLGEALGGAYTGLNTDGFGFVGGTFSDLAGGAQLGFSTLGFDPAGFSVGLHSQTIDLSTFSHYALPTGIFNPFLPNNRFLPDLNLGDTQITVEANVLGVPPVAGVPEPATWALLTGGFGLIGAVMRRRERQTA